jgi:hypothetical protein
MQYLSGLRKRQPTLVKLCSLHLTKKPIKIGTDSTAGLLQLSIIEEKKEVAVCGLHTYKTRLMDNTNAVAKRDWGIVPSMLVGAALGLVVCILFGVALMVLRLMV